MKERPEHSDIGQEPADREAYEALFETICAQAKESFLRRGSHEPMLLVLTRLGLAMVRVEFPEGFDREPIARSIGENIRRTAIKTNDEPVYDEPLAVILASEAWMVEYDETEDRATTQLPPRLHPRRKEILQVTLRTTDTSFSRNWPIIRKRRKASLGEPVDLSGEGMESVWDAILTSEQ